MMPQVVAVDRPRLAALLMQEEARFRDSHPRSRALFERARGCLQDGLPMPWLAKWAGGFPVFVDRGRGASLTDVDGKSYVDFCLGDTGAMTGHAPDPAVVAVRGQAARGFSFMLPAEDHVWVAEELSRRFGLPIWQFALSATDANRFAIRIARAVTGRPRILVFNWCYHGTVDETFAVLVDGRVVPRPGNLGPPVNPALTTRVVEFNDVAGLERELAAGDVACVLAEPVMTNVGIIHPEPGFHAALRKATRRHGTLLVLDETHTICAGPGGCTARDGLDPDLLTIGKPVASGVPAAAYGLAAEVAARLSGRIATGDCDTAGIGGTLAGNALAVAAMRATLSQVLTPDAYARAIPLAERFQAGVEEVIGEFGLPWIVKRLGCRVEYWFSATPPRSGGEAIAAADPELDRFMHLFALNRGILLTPFHNMALIAPQTSDRDIDYHTEVFRAAVQSLADRASTD